MHYYRMEVLAQEGGGVGWDFDMKGTYHKFGMNISCDVLAQGVIILIF